jgi:hypothetical protein
VDPWLKNYYTVLNREVERCGIYPTGSRALRRWRHTEKQDAGTHCRKDFPQRRVSQWKYYPRRSLYACRWVIFNRPKCCRAFRFSSGTQILGQHRMKELYTTTNAAKERAFGAVFEKWCVIPGEQGMSPEQEAQCRMRQACIATETESSGNAA